MRSVQQDGARRRPIISHGLILPPLSSYIFHSVKHKKRERQSNKEILSCGSGSIAGFESARVSISSEIGERRTAIASRSRHSHKIQQRTALPAQLAANPVDRG